MNILMILEACPKILTQASHVSDIIQKTSFKAGGLFSPSHASRFSSAFSASNEVVSLSCFSIVRLEIEKFF